VIYDPEVVEILESITPRAWKGVVFRHMFGDFLPDRENISGARWNPQGTPAIYTSLTRKLVIAEGDYQFNSQNPPPTVDRKIYRIELSLQKVLDLTSWPLLERLGIIRASYGEIEPTRCKEVGGAVEWLYHDGLIVPSARAKGNNLVVYPNQQSAGYRFKILDVSVLGTDGAWGQFESL
jgi:RES domain-containing protein